MHMSDALISPLVGGIMSTASVAVLVVSARKLEKNPDDKRAPLMGVLGAFVFASQMINFSIPVTGSSGHLIGSLLLAIILGPAAGFIVIASTLIVQSLFFADGGLLALGCNIFNMGFIPCFIGYRLIYKKFAKYSSTKSEKYCLTILCAIISTEIAAFGVVLETVFSGISDLPFSTFTLLMLSIHLPIAIVEGVITTVLVTVLAREKPELLSNTNHTPVKFKLLPLFLGTLFIAIFVSLYASTKPDGLEWSLRKSAIPESSQTREISATHTFAKKLQKITAFLPAYGFKKTFAPKQTNHGSADSTALAKSLSGFIGSCLLLIIMLCFGFLLRKKLNKNLNPDLNL